ncbi:hypothetical protein EDD15DRAFT_2200789 [Pisolithus albus]|nr:hypothetical protein EDD15DRAFT_2200789 [Pisolithus albus]
MSDETHNTTVKMLENLEVDNILQVWPAYVITFTPEDTRPHKIILHLKNPSKYVTVESDDEDNDTGAQASEYRKLITNSDGRVMVTVQDNNGPSLQYESEETSDDGDDETSECPNVGSFWKDLAVVREPLRIKSWACREYGSIRPWLQNETFVM